MGESINGKAPESKPLSDKTEKTIAFTYVLVPEAAASLRVSVLQHMHILSLHTIYVPYFCWHILQFQFLLLPGYVIVH